MPWAYFSGALVAATNIVVENQRVITKVYFPRLILPVSATLSGLVDFSISLAVLLIFTLAYGIRPTLAVLLLPLFLLLAILTVLGVGLWLSALNALYRDVRYLIPFIVQFWTLASPVYYSSTMVPEQRMRIEPGPIMRALRDRRGHECGAIPGNMIVIAVDEHPKENARLQPDRSSGRLLFER